MSTFPTAEVILEHLQKTGLVSHLDVESTSPPSPTTDFFLFHLEGPAEKDADPLELLQAFKPEGVICYFSALAYYGLTTQIPSQHHIATLTAAAIPARKTDKDRQESLSRETVKRNPMGQKVFTFQGIPFFWTRRIASRIAGIQIRQEGTRTQFRITTREQTLLDTLNRPIPCGGLAVILEAWEKGARTMDEKRLAEHLKTMSHADTCRRVGAIFDLIGHPPAPCLKKQLDAIKPSLPSQTSKTIISLLPGINFPNTNDIWQVSIP
ncbi:MAG: type IV toxin-antitoxin system AbiEi family antitoxin [Verrucomicrobiae bacterium]|nr:type IV toxin-antitoxin system AbiEi family antitoxin [Verrucomicrobiae bacterium]